MDANEIVLHEIDRHHVRVVGGLFAEGVRRPPPGVNDMLLSGIGFGENPTNARLVPAEAPRDLDLAVAPALYACAPGRARMSKNGREGRTVGRPLTSRENFT